jgi:acetylornithine deacetylase
MDPIPILKELIAIPSVNPMGREVSGPEYLETRLTAYLGRFFAEQGIEHQRIEVAPGRSNVIARIDQPGLRRTVLLDAHQDTVPVDGMTISPFEPAERDGRVYGRGACDVKGGLAAMLGAMVRLARERPPGAANVVMSCTCDEEATVLGITDLVRLWTDRTRAGSLLSSPPDVAIVAEPTRLDVVVAHRGAVRWKIVTRGRACHSSRPSEGVNAIYRMAKVLNVLEDYAARLPEMIRPHALCGPATLSVGRVHGGLSVNTVPDECAIEIDRRLLPGEDGRRARQAIIDGLKDRLDFEPEHLEPWIAGATLSDEHNGPLADRLLRHIAPVAGPHQKIGVPYGTHASRTAAAGVPSVVFGPGNIDQAHTDDEWIAVDQVRQASEIYYRFCAAEG